MMLFSIAANGQTNSEKLKSINDNMTACVELSDSPVGKSRVDAQFNALELFNSNMDLIYGKGKEDEDIRNEIQDKLDYVLNHWYVESSDHPTFWKELGFGDDYFTLSVQFDKNGKCEHVLVVFPVEAKDKYQIAFYEYGPDYGPENQTDFKDLERFLLHGIAAHEVNGQRAGFQLYPDIFDRFLNRQCLGLYYETADKSDKTLHFCPLNLDNFKKQYKEYFSK